MTAHPDGLLSDYTIDEDSSITITFNLTDVETPAETLTMQVVTGNSSLVPQSRVTISGLEDTDPAASIKLVPLPTRMGMIPSPSAPVTASKLRYIRSPCTLHR
jgi:hypothetical protein